MYSESIIDEDIPELIPPLYHALEFICEFILESEIGIIPLFSYSTVNQFTFASDAKAAKDKQVVKVPRMEQVVQISQDVQVTKGLKSKELEKIEGVTDDSYLYMSVPEFNNYIKKLGLNDYQRSILKLGRRRMNNRKYSKDARFKRKTNKQNIIKNEAKIPANLVTG